MSKSQLTDERLRYWLDANQVNRERLCVSILSLSGQYSHVRPRLPRGGPDGGRDIEATFQGEEEAFAAVGFRNSATDSPADVRWVKKKFTDDLNSALNSQSELKVFVFLTNVDLTPGEEDYLKGVALKRSIGTTDIFDRERLRIILDSPEGLAARFMYLGISMSEAEQAAFFERYGRQLEQTIIKNFQVVDNRLDRIEFFQQSSKPLYDIALYFKLRTPKTLQELYPFHIQAELVDMHTLRTLHILGYYASQTNDDNKVHSHTVYRDGIKLTSQGLIQHNDLITQDLIKFLAIGAQVNRLGCFSTLDDFRGAFVSILLNEQLFHEIESVVLHAGGYNLINLDLNYYIPLPANYETNRLDFLVDDVPLLGKTKWVRIGSEEDPGKYGIFYFDFNSQTPQKASRKELVQYQLYNPVGVG